MSEKRYGVLIPCFNRPDLLQKRLLELSNAKNPSFQLFISLDGPRSSNDVDCQLQERCHSIANDYAATHACKVWREPSNLGCDLHIPRAISRALLEVEALLVIEDDVSLPIGAIEIMLNKALEIDLDAVAAPVLSISSFNKSMSFAKNTWRRSPYFSAWGYVISREFWNLHVCTQKSLGSGEKISNSLHVIESWNRLSERKKRIWLERFSRGNYDYQIQLTLMLNSMLSYVPMFRLCDNEGFSLATATHTKYKKPYYLRTSVRSKSLEFGNFKMPKMMQRLFQFMDSNTWAGDGFLSLRGRNRGIRSIVRQTILKLKTVFAKVIFL